MIGYKAGYYVKCTIQSIIESTGQGGELVYTTRRSKQSAEPVGKQRLGATSRQPVTGLYRRLVCTTRRTRPFACCRNPR